MERIKKCAKFFILFFSFTLYTLPFTLYAIVSPIVEVSTVTIFQESFNKLKEGDYRGAMLGFMDIILVDPNNAKAIEYLKKAGNLCIKGEVYKLQKEYKETVREAHLVKEKLNQLKKDKSKRLKQWKKLFSETCNLAENPDTILLALRYYENFLNRTPVYSGGVKEFERYVHEIKKRLYQTIKSQYSGWIGTKKSIDERDIATVFFAKEADNDFSYRYVYSGAVQEILDTAYKIKSIENKILSIFRNAQEALEYYTRGRYEKAIESWKEVIKFDLNNEEALFYVDLAKKRLGIQEEIDTSIGRQTTADAKKQLRIQQEAETPVEIKEFQFKNAMLPSESQGITNIKAESAPSVEKPVKKLKSVRKKKTRLPKITTTTTTTESMLKEAETLYEKGVQEFSAGNYEGAKISWEECLKLNPKHLKAKVGLERIKQNL